MCDLLVVGVELGEDGAAFTVTTGPLAETATAVAPLPTVTVAVNVILSPVAADFGTTTCASASAGGAAVAAGRDMSQEVLLVQPTVNVGGASVGVVLLATTFDVAVPDSLTEAQAEILNRTVPPGCTLVWGAVTITLGLGGGVGVGVGVGLVDGDVEGDVLGLLGDAVAVARGWVDPAGVLVALAEVVAFGVLDALVEVVAFGVVDVLDAFAALGAKVEVDGFAVGDGVAAVVAARADVVMPLDTTKMPVAKPSVTGRECADRMRTPCLC